MQVAEAGFANKSDVPATLEVQSDSTLLLAMEGDGAPPMLFERCSAEQLWFVAALWLATLWT